MITKRQAIEAQEFHEEGCVRAVGPRGGVTTTVAVWRRNGKTQTWVRSPERFRVPVKYGMYAFHAITEKKAHMFHVPEDCPLCKTVGGTMGWVDSVIEAKAEERYLETGKRPGEE